MAEENDEKKRWKWSLNVEKTPCARESLALGISAGLLVGALMFVRTKIIRRSCDYAVGSFALVSLASWEVCSYSRYQERQKVKKAVGLLNEYEKKRANHSGLDPTET